MANPSDFRAPLFSPETIAGLRRMAAGERYPKKTLGGLRLNCCEAERAVHVAQVAGDAAALAAAVLARCDAAERLLAEQVYVADVHLAGASHAAEFKPEEAAEVQAKLLGTPAGQAALVPIVQALLQPTIDWLRGEMRDVADRVADLEHAINEMGVMA